MFSNARFCFTKANDHVNERFATALEHEYLGERSARSTGRDKMTIEAKTHYANAADIFFGLSKLQEAAPCYSHSG